MIPVKFNWIYALLKSVHNAYFFLSFSSFFLKFFKNISGYFKNKKIHHMHIKWTIFSLTIMLELALFKQKLNWSKMITHLPWSRRSSVCKRCITDLSTIRGTQNHSGFYKHMVSLESVNHRLRKPATLTLKVYTCTLTNGERGKGGGVSGKVQQNVNKNMFVRQGIYLWTLKK